MKGSSCKSCTSAIVRCTFCGGGGGFGVDDSGGGGGGGGGGRSEKSKYNII